MISHMLKEGNPKAIARDINKRATDSAIFGWMRYPDNGFETNRSYVRFMLINASKAEEKKK